MFVPLGDRAWDRGEEKGARNKNSLANELHSQTKKGRCRALQEGTFTSPLLVARPASYFSAFCVLEISVASDVVQGTMYCMCGAVLLECSSPEPSGRTTPRCSDGKQTLGEKIVFPVLSGQ